MNNNSQKIPEFLLKLKKLVDSPHTDKLIFWNQDGKSFGITDGHQLAKEYFPYLFKHRNIFSFIRQLNMYGFHKISRQELNSNNNKACCDDSEWSHPDFVKNRTELLYRIQRKISPNVENNSMTLTNNQNDPFTYELYVLKSACRQLRMRDQMKSSKILDLERQNDSIKKELSDFKIQMESQSRWINEIYESLSVYFPSNFKSTLLYNGPIKRKLLALIPAVYKSQTNSNSNSISSSTADDFDPTISHGKIRKLDWLKSEKVVNVTANISDCDDGRENPLSKQDFNEDFHNSNLFVVDDNYQTTIMDYDVDDLLNNS